MCSAVMRTHDVKRSPVYGGPLDRVDARGAADRCCALTEALSPPASPSIGVERARLAKLLAHDGRLEHAKESWRRALRVLEIAHGSASNLVRTLRANLSDVELQSASAQLRIA